jgi:hypothetical protein
MKKNLYTQPLKRFGKLCLLTAGLLLPTWASSQDVTTGLMTYYSFEDISGTTVTDGSGNANNGTLQGAATASNGFSGNGVICTAKSDYILLPQNLNASLKSFTYATWANFKSLNTGTRFFDFGNSTDDNNPTVFLAFLPNNSGSLSRMRYRPQGGTGAINVDATTATPMGQWAHIAITFSWDETTTTGTAIIYINGVACGTSTFAGFNPSLLGNTAYNFIGRSRWAQDGNGMNATLDDIRFYNRALTASDITALYTLTPRQLMLQNGYTEALISAQEKLALTGDLTQITAPLTLPTSADGNVQIVWKSSNTAVMDSLGNITRPSEYDATVKLTATLSQAVGEKTYKLTKDFTVVVKALKDVAMMLAKWDYVTDSIRLVNNTIQVASESETNFVGTLMNDASIRTIGQTEKFNVLDLGNGTGYFDMGQEIGKAIYSLNNYTMCGYFRIANDYTELNTNGNFYWTFSNTADAMNDPTGYIIASLKSQVLSIASGRYDNGNQAVGPGTNAPVNGWHHLAFTQKSDTATIYIDGAVIGTGTITNLPSNTLVRSGRTGTLYNWLGRSNYTGDVYLRKTLLYDFQLWRDAMTSDDLNFGLEISNTLDKLNNAYAEDSNYVDPALVNEMNNLTLNNITNVSSNITLPTKGSLNTSVAIIWKSSHPTLISNEGVVNTCEYGAFPVTLTATLFLNGQTQTKTFAASVAKTTNSGFTGSLLVKYDFETITNDTIVTDAAEKHFTGIVKAPANIKTIGLTMPYKVLDLANGTGYFDMGAEMGKALVHLTDYTASVYYRVDTVYKSLGTAGNFLVTLSNSTNAGTDMNGNIFFGLNNQSVDITPKYWAVSSGSQGISVGSAALTGSWHNMTYVQKADTGYIYVDGIMVASDTVTNKPTCLVQPSLLGTPYNWLGRSCYTSDCYLRNTLVYDFRLYSRALTEEEIQTSVLKVGETVNGLEAAYAETPVVKLHEQDKAAIEVMTSNGLIRIKGLHGTESVSLFDLAGRQVRVTTSDEISVKAGLYLLKVNNNVTKVFVR